MRGRASVASVITDMTDGLNWLTSKTGEPRGPNLRFNIKPVNWVVSKAINLSSRTIWAIIKLALEITLGLAASFEKVKTLISIGKQIILYGKLFVIYLPVERLSGKSTLKDRVSPAPANYNETINKFKDDIEGIEGKMKELEVSYGKIHKSDQAASKYDEYSRTLTDIIQKMHTYIDDNCSIVYAGPAPNVSRSSSIDVNSLVRHISNPLQASGQLSYKKKNKKTKKKSKK